MLYVHISYVARYCAVKTYLNILILLNMASLFIAIKLAKYPTRLLYCFYICNNQTLTQYYIYNADRRVLFSMLINYFAPQMVLW